MRVTGIDHVVFNVSDVEKSVAWWRDLIGLEPVRLDEWRRGEVPFVSVRISPGTIIDLFARERSGDRTPTSTRSPRRAASTSCADRSSCSGRWVRATACTSAIPTAT